MAIQDKISFDDMLTKNIILNWENVIPKITDDDLLGTIKLEGVEAKKYMFDLEGFLITRNIVKEFIYPIIRINGFYSSTDYDGKDIELKIIDAGILTKYYTLFND